MRTGGALARRLRFALALVAATGGAAPSSPQEGPRDLSALEAGIVDRIAMARSWAREPAVIRAVRRANASPRTLEEIQARDRDWQAAAGVDGFMRELMTNECAERLRALSAPAPELSEAFVTDRLGANVAMTRKTSDFWQGDEAKFQNVMTRDPRSYHVDDVAFDESIQAYAVQISVPVLGDDAPMGVLVVTVNLERLDSR